MIPINSLKKLSIASKLLADSSQNSLGSVVHRRGNYTLQTEREHFIAIYTEHHQYLRNFLYRLGFDNELDDMVQTVFEKAWKKISSYKGNAAVRTWITSIAINTAKDYWKSKKIKKALHFDGKFEEVFPEDRTTQESQLTSKQLVALGLEQLNSDQRLVIVLCMIESYPLEEAALILGTPVGTLKSRLNRSKTILKDFFNQIEGKENEKQP